MGPNGSGKTTFLKLLMGFIFPGAGQIDLGQLSPDRIGYVPERPFLPPHCRLEEYLTTVGRLSGLRGAVLRHAVASRLRQVGLSDTAQWRINACSREML